MNGLPIVVILLFMLVLLTIYNVFKSKGRSKKFITIANGVLYSVILLLCLLSLVDGRTTEKRREQYDVHAFGFLAHLTYDHSDSDYHYIKESGLFFYERYVAVPKDNVKLSPVTNIYSPVKLVCTKDSALFDDRRDNPGDSQAYISGDSVVKIVPDYSFLRTDIALIAILIMLIVNILQLCFVFISAHPVEEISRS